MLESLSIPSYVSLRGRARLQPCRNGGKIDGALAPEVSRDNARVQTISRKDWWERRKLESKDNQVTSDRVPGENPGSVKHVGKEIGRPEWEYVPTYSLPAI